MSLEIKFQESTKKSDPRADQILTGFEENDDPILIPDDEPDPASLGLPVSFDSSKTSKITSKSLESRQRGPQDKNRRFNITGGKDCNRNFKCVLSMWQSRRIETHPKPAKFQTTLIDPSPQNRQYRCRLTLPTLDNYDKSYVHSLRWAAENFAGKDCLDHIVKKRILTSVYET
ncbi:Oidioi.mRNA.OKI2018_I69.chr2.g6720.t1.cds [Oikopleura dioica]|uniref:Oidioi.mRNA.OKI2018_I69.chr2.g6720.t1.cds n=1 Tax=Oikopleura dioica TaxID=34765 RepID=A0ABN7T8P8_OIKDI|nr:Oidioi.mRNA.OKI2018_I69.chr2.g6720.t1.cds [Oikopleura dioica]